MLIHAEVDIRTDELHGTIAKEEVCPADMVTAEVIDMADRIIGGVIADTEDANQSFFSAWSGARPG